MARINHITSVKNLRNFIAFDASNVKLAKNEAIYANNGSGKTNISRLFYYLKNPELNINDLLSREANETDRIEFVIDFDGTIINQDNYKNAPIQDLLKLVQVFNSDFRDVNISCPDFGDKHLESELVIEVGEPDTRAKQIKKQISDAENQIKKMHTSISNDFSAYIEGIKGSEFKANETNIWRHCSLESIIDPATKKIETEYLNSLTEKRQADKLAVSVQKRNDLLDLEGQEELKYSQLELPTPDINRIDDVLAVINEFPDVDEDTEANFKSISHWLSHEVLAEGSSTEKVLLTGISLSEDDAKCILCKRALDHESKELFQSYEAYLNAEKSKFVQKIKDMNVELLGIMDKAKAINNNVGAEVNRLSKLFEIDDRWIEYDTEKLLNALETYSVLLHEKTNDISVSFGYIELDNARLLIESINDKIRKNTLLTEKLDRKIDNTVSQLAEQRKYIGQKLLLDFYKTKKDSFDLIKSSFVAIEVDKTKLSKILESLPTIDSRSNISKLMNYFLHDRVGIDKYNSEVIDDQIVIKLNGFNISQSTRLISEGEQTILGLCYFLASSIDEL
ncbi:MAG: hypothetical protein QG593_686, partial [Patescibacteria group bacterium]|nr:hypothetical protein [Patescibacteria group bacterium]